METVIRLDLTEMEFISVFMMLYVFRVMAQAVDTQTRPLDQLAYKLLQAVPQDVYSQVAEEIKRRGGKV